MMGYFSNGTEGELYRERWCEHCRHDGNHDDDPFCEVWSLHLQFNYGQTGDAKTILTALIPRSADGLTNEQCGLFVQQHEMPLFDAEPRRAR